MEQSDASNRNNECCHSKGQQEHIHKKSSENPTSERPQIVMNDVSAVEPAISPMPSQPMPSHFVLEDVFHPLDDLTVREIKKSVILIRAELKQSKRIGFCQIVLHEPPKKVVQEFDKDNRTDKPIYREAFAIVLDHAHEKTFELYIALSPPGYEHVISCTHIPGVQPPLLSNEYEICEDIVRNDPRVMSVLKKKGVTDMSTVMVDLWIGFFSDPKHRISTPLLFYRGDDHENGYARPVDGLEVVVDLNKMKVLEVKEFPEMEGTPIPPYYKFSHWQNLRTTERGPVDLKPIEIIQPEGVSFIVNKQRIEWQGWSMRVGFNKREGMVLHTISHYDKSKQKYRPIMYRASIAEMVVPYGDTRYPNYIKNAFDAGEDGLGTGVHSLELGCDCLGAITYMDVTLVDGNGSPYVVKNAICIHEEDNGILWKHKEWRTNTIGVRRSRKLVVSFFTTIANYDYGFYWYFLQDGTIKFETKLTGILSTSAIRDGESTGGFGTIVAPNLYAPIHQHFMTARLDMQVDGVHNYVEEVNVQAPEPHEPNPYKSAFYATHTIFHNEQQAQRAVVPARAWRIVNSKTTNTHGEHCAWKLIPQNAITPFAHHDSAIMFKASHLRNNLWVTPFNPKELYPAGNYTIQKVKDDGLNKWTKANRKIYNTDIVVWHNFGLTHVSRAEDWPVMPTEYCGFTLKPDNFFDHNISIDLPPSRTDACCVVPPAKL